MFSSYSSTYRHHEVLRSIFQYLRLILSMHIISLWRMDANVDFTWRVCFDFYARWPDFLEAEMLAHVIKFENCFTLSIRIKGFCIVIYDVNPLTPIPQNGQTHSNNSLANRRRIVWVCLTILWNWRKKKVWVDNNENYVKMTIMLKPISEVSNVKLQIIVLFYFLILWMRLVLLIFFVRGARRS